MPVPSKVDQMVIAPTEPLLAICASMVMYGAPLTPMSRNSHSIKPFAVDPGCGARNA